jgi:deoxycytidylate deaminase
MKLIINAGITQVYYSIPYDDPDAKILEAAAKTAAVLEITQVDGPKE